MLYNFITSALSENSNPVIYVHLVSVNMHYIEFRDNDYCGQKLPRHFKMLTCVLTYDII
jgi:hypothetical protein